MYAEPLEFESNDTLELEDVEFDNSESKNNNDLSIRGSQAFINIKRTPSLIKDSTNFFATKRILIVDDEIFNLQAMLIILRVAALQLGISVDMLE